MKDLVLCCLLVVSGVVTTVWGDCDSIRCVGLMKGINYGNTKDACSKLKPTASCLENVINTCELLPNKKQYMTQLTSLKQSLRTLCNNIVPAIPGSYPGYHVLPPACDSMRCVHGISHLNYNKMIACPSIKSATKCMDNVLDKCKLHGDHKSALRHTMHLSKIGYRHYCGEYTSGAGSVDLMFLCVVAISMVTGFINYF